jgi:ribonuclease Z
MQVRRLTVLGTASQVPTARRNHIGFFLRWDKEGILFDPGEGTQRQLLLAGIKSSEITKICLTHFHGDHCLGLPGVVQRLSLDKVEHQVKIFYPASGQKYLDNLLEASAFRRTVDIEECPVHHSGIIYVGQGFYLEAHPLDHGIDTWGYRLKEPDSRTIQPDLLPSELKGPAIGELKNKGSIEFEGRRIALDEVSKLKYGQCFAMVMDTRICENAFKLAYEADLLLCESTYLADEEELAYNYRHLTAGQAAHIAKESGSKLLVLAHYSQRYSEVDHFAREAAEIHPQVIAAEDGKVVFMPKIQRDFG